MPQWWDLGVPWGGGGLRVIFCFPKFNQIWCVSYLHEWHMHRRHFLWPPLVPWGGTKRSNIIKSELQSQFQRFLNQTHKWKIYNTSDGIFIRPPRSYPWVGLRGTMGVGGQFFYEIQPDLVCELLIRMAHAPAKCFGSPPPGALGRGHKNYFSGHGHVEYKIKGDEQDTLNNFNLRSNWWPWDGVKGSITIRFLRERGDLWWRDIECVLVYIYINAHTHTHTYARTHAHIHTHTHTHTHTHSDFEV